MTSVRRVAKEGMVSSSQAPAAGSSQCCLALEKKQASIVNTLGRIRPKLISR